MSIYDWVVIALAIAFAVRGWRRGFLRELLDWFVLVFGAVIAFRLSPVIGTILSGMANIPYEVGRVIAGVLILVALVVASFLLGNVIARAMKIVPGVTALNRIGGAAVGVAFALVIVVLSTALAAAVPLPASAEASVEESISSSAIGSAIVDPGGPVLSALSVASGEEVYGAVIAVRDAVGDRLAAGTLPIPLPDVGDAPLPPSQTIAQAMFDALNRHRIAAGEDPLAWSADLAVVAVARTTAAYRSGVLSVDDDLTSSLRAAGVPGTTHADLIVLAATTDGLVEAVVGASAYERIIVDASYRKAGIGVVEGPYGLMSVAVLSG